MGWGKWEHKQPSFDFAAFCVPNFCRVSLYKTYAFFLATVCSCWLKSQYKINDFLLEFLHCGLNEVVKNSKNNVAAVCKHWAMKWSRGHGGKNLFILYLSTALSEWPASLSGRFNLGEIIPENHWINSNWRSRCAGEEKITQPTVILTCLPLLMSG